MFESINFTPGKVTFNALEDLIDINEEDLFQVTYSDGKYVIDLGWYGFRYVIKVVENLNWKKPILEKEFYDIHHAEESMIECVEFVKKIYSI
jgi:hypothetical protein